MPEQVEYTPDVLPDYLPVYYKRLFPYNLYFQWLNYGGIPKYYTHREFSFTLKDDVYIRYQSFSDQAELEKEIQKKCPYKIDIGAVFSHRPKEHKMVKSSAFIAQEKELVFDIDMTDYDDVRSCCQGADICPKCWPLMTIAIKIINTALRDDFGYEHLLWIYSGRRGVHCWVCDESARKLSQAGRTAIAEYLSLVKGGESKIKKVSLLEKLHPSVKRAIKTIDEHFDDYANNKQEFMEDEKKCENVLKLLQNDGLESDIKEAFKRQNPDSSAEHWNILKENVEKNTDRKNRRSVEEIMLQYTYPRLDVNVSKGVNHLLKSPFCLHPKTGRVCVPIDVEKVEKFDPFTVPNISQLIDELNSKTEGESAETEKKSKDYSNTSIDKYLGVFEKFVKKLDLHQRKEKGEKSMEF